MDGGTAQSMFVLEQPEKSSRKKDKLMRSCLACFAKKQTVSYPISSQLYIRQAARGPLRGVLFFSYARVLSNTLEPFVCSSSD